MDPRTHWETLYRTNSPTAVSWYQPHSEQSLAFIHRTGLPKSGRILDVGGGASTLVDDLLAAGYEHVTVLDISDAALEVARARLGERAADVQWLAGDVTRVELPAASYDLWHDRAVFHFLTAADDRARYVAAVRRAVKPGGHVVVATFAEDGPEKCSGLEVARYSPDALHDQFGDDFTLVASARETHLTPAGGEQRFVYCYCRVAGA